ncbi:MAG: hypothetical protein RIF32_14460 [Leptospirales bacterium]|jgi:hypothetical protein
MQAFYDVLFSTINAWPLWYAKAGALFIFAAFLALVWSLPRAYIYEEGDALPGHRDLRYWASALLAIQLALYWIF